MSHRLCGLAGLAMIVALAVAGPAEGAITIGDCTAEAVKPTGVKRIESGRKYSSAQARVRCATAQRVQVDVQLWGEDPVSDDRMDYWRLTFKAEPEKAHNLNKRNSVLDQGWPTCNEDSPGKDELYSKIRVRVDPSNSGSGTLGPWSDWSKWTNSKTITVDCG